MLEVVLVIVIISILASIAVQSLQKADEIDRFEATVKEMGALARAITGDDRLISGGIRSDFGYVGDIGSLPPDLDALAVNPGGYSTWKGPYIKQDFIENSGGFKKDAWNNPYSYNGGISISSSGGGNSITKQLVGSAADLLSNTIKGTIRDRSGSPPADSAANVVITVFYPDGAGSVTGSSVSPSRSGEFIFADFVPIGLHKIQAIVTGVNDTTIRYIAVNPGSETLAELRFPFDLWGPVTGGGGGGSGIIELVPGSQSFGNNCGKIQFDITNSGGAPVDLVNLTLTWTSPSAWYNKVRIGNVLFNQPNNGKGSGEMAPFSIIKTIAPGATETVNIETFDDNRDGTGTAVNMANTVFTITFSDGSTIIVAMGGCI